jgi:hypothetical protein
LCFIFDNKKINWDNDLNKYRIMKKLMKSLLIFLLIIIVILVAAFIYVDKNQGKIAALIIKEQFKKSRLSKVYHLDFAKLDLNLFSGKITIHNFSLKPDTNFYLAGDSLRFKYPLLVDAEVPFLSLSGIDMLELIQHKRLIIEGIDINDPGFRLINHLSEKEKELSHKLREAQPPEETPEADTTTATKMKLSHLTLAHFAITGGSAEYYNRVTDKSIFTVQGIQMLLSEVAVNPEKPLDVLIEKSYGSIKFGVGEVKFRNEGGFYDVDLGQVALDVADNSLKLKNVKLTPKYSKAQFGKKVKKQTDRFDAKIGSLELHGLDLKKLIRSGGIKLNSIRIDSLNLEIFRDKNDPFDFNNFPKFPWQGLTKINSYLQIDTIEVTNSAIFYEELAEGRTEAGKVPLGKVHISLLNVSNDSVYISKHGPMICRFEAKAFNQGDLLLNLNIPADLSSSEFSFSGRIGPMDMRAFNSITELNVLVNIEKGTLDSLIFSAHADGVYATGELTMVYDSLKINVLSKDKDKSKAHGIGILSWVGNQVVKSFNPVVGKPDNKPDIALIFVERDINKSVFNYIVKAFISGIKGTLVPGIGPTLKKYEKQKVKEQKKEERQQKRAEKKKERR